MRQIIFIDKKSNPCVEPFSNSVSQRLDLLDPARVNSAMNESISNITPIRSQRYFSALLLTIALITFDIELLLHPFSSPFGFPEGDYATFLWNFWWLKQSVLNLQSPFITQMLFDGQTAGLFYHTLSILYFILTSPLQIFSDDPIFLFNVSVILADVLGLCFTYRLARYFQTSRALACLIAVFLIFSAYRLQHGTTLNLLSIWLIPCYLLLTAKLLQKKRTRDGIALGLSLLALLLACWHYLIFLFLFTPFYLLWLYCIRSDKSSSDITALWKPAGLSLIIVLPLLGFYIYLAISQAEILDIKIINPITRIRWSASPLYFLTPGWLEFFWESRVHFAPEFAEIFSKNADSATIVEILSYKTGMEYSLYLGSIPLLMLFFRLFQIVRYRSGHRSDLVLLCALLLFFLLSLGPILIVINPVLSASKTLFVLPFQPVFDLPIFSSIKHLSRFGLMVLVIVLLLVMKNRNTAQQSLPKTFSPAIFLICLFLIFLHRVDMQPFVAKKTFWKTPPELVHALHQPLPEGHAMIFPPVNWQNESISMFLQTIHERPILHGYLSRMPKGVMQKTFADPFLLWLSSTSGSLAPDVKHRPALFVLLHNRVDLNQGKMIIKRLVSEAEYRLIYHNNDILVFSRSVSSP